MDNTEKRVNAIKKLIKLHRFLKTISWRNFAWGLTTVLAWWFFGDIEKALTLGAIDVVIKLFAFYAHDTSWAKYTDRKIKDIKTEFPKD